MNRDKQIEEMANDYYEAMLKARGTLGSMNKGAPKWYAKELYAKGYRKANEVAREIFEEIERILDFNTFEGDVFIGKYFDIDLKNDLAELKKKYTESEE